MMSRLGNQELTATKYFQYCKLNINNEQLNYWKYQWWVSSTNQQHT